MLTITIPETTYTGYAAHAEARDGTVTRVSAPDGLPEAHAAAGMYADQTARRYRNGFCERRGAGWDVFDGARFIAHVSASRVRPGR
jgi:hypothetical protein